MKLTEEQWQWIEPLIPKTRVRKDRKGRPSTDRRQLVQGMLWILKTGARWQDLPRDRFPPYQTVHRHYQNWVAKGVFKKILERLVEHLREKGKINLAETFIDASFAEAKKGVKKSAKPSLVRELRSWQSATISLFRSRYPLRVLHQLRLRSLKKQFGRGIAKTYLRELSETKLTILILTTSIYDDDLESNLLLPTSAIAKSHRLKMDEIFVATKEDGELSDYFRGSRIFDE
jgi:transposase